MNTKVFTTPKNKLEMIKHEPTKKNRNPKPRNSKRKHNLRQKHLRHNTRNIRRPWIQQRKHSKRPNDSKRIRIHPRPLGKWNIHFRIQQKLKNPKNFKLLKKEEDIQNASQRLNRNIIQMQP